MIFFALVILLIVVLCINIYVKRDPISRNKVSVKTEFTRDFCEPNTEFYLNTEISNFSKHAMHRLYVAHDLHEAFVATDQDNFRRVAIGSVKQKQLTLKSSVKAENVKKISIGLKIDRRGIYALNGVNLTFVDFLGFHSSTYEKKANNRIIVAPKKVDNGFLSALVTSGYGDFNAKRGFIYDEMSVSTYDEYTGREPMRQISWKKSAEAGTLLVKKFEPMGAHVTTIVFDAYGYREVKFGSKSYMQIEYAISMLREIFEYFERKRIAYRLITNAKSPSLYNYSFTSQPSGKKTKMRMLTMLGELNYNSKYGTSMDSEDLLDYAVKNSYRGPFVYLAPVDKRVINLRLKKISKAKGLEIIELYAEKFCNDKTLRSNEVKA